MAKFILAVISTLLFDLASGQDAQERTLYLGINVLWEGIELNHSSAQALKRFKSHFNDLQLLHFIDPVYGIRGTKKQKQKSYDAIKNVLSSQDKVGLYVHPWYSLIKKAGVIFRHQPSIWGQRHGVCVPECGHEVPISVYTKPELKKIFKTALEALKPIRPEKPDAFMAGGWLASPHVLEVAAKMGFKRDFSPIPVELLTGRLKYFPIFTWLLDLWSSYAKGMQPYFLQTNAGWMQQIGINGATLDYLSLKEAIAIYHVVLNQATIKSRPIYLNYGVYQETAYIQIDKLIKLLKYIKKDSQSRGVVLKTQLPKLTDKMFRLARSDLLDLPR